MQGRHPRPLRQIILVNLLSGRGHQRSQHHAFCDLKALARRGILEARVADLRTSQKLLETLKNNDFLKVFFQS